jgi:hypothetical protein
MLFNEKRDRISWQEERADFELHLGLSQVRPGESRKQLGTGASELEKGW